MQQIPFHIIQTNDILSLVNSQIVTTSEKKLWCGGLACPKCDRCRDWIQLNDSTWKIRDNATCNPSYISYIDYLGNTYHGPYDGLCNYKWDNEI